MTDLFSSIKQSYPSSSDTIARILSSKGSRFQKIRSALLTVGYVKRDNLKGEDSSRSNPIEVPTYNYDELLTNINVSNLHEYLEDTIKEANIEYGDLMYQAITIRTSVTNILTQTIRANLYNRMYKLKSSVFKVFPEQVVRTISACVIGVSSSKIKKISIDIERGILLYTILISPTITKTVVGWTDENFRVIYHTKANSILGSLSNDDYNSLLMEGLLSELIKPIEVAFLMRSQLLPLLFERWCEDKLRYYEELGITNADVDYTTIISDVQCHKCKGYHTDYTQLQTRSADEPMTIFYYCYKCGNRGRR